MTGEQYRRWSAPFRPSKRARALRLLNRALTAGVFVLYPLLLADLALGRDGRLMPCVLVPGSGFLVVSVFRRWYNAPRPYEALDIQPLKEKDRRGQSFPSRHVFSAFVIAVTGLWLFPPLGLALMGAGAALAWCRVILGVHWPRDVAAGAALGLLWGLAGFWLLS